MIHGYICCFNVMTHCFSSCQDLPFKHLNLDEEVPSLALVKTVLLVIPASHNITVQLWVYNFNVKQDSKQPGVVFKDSLLLHFENGSI